MSFLQEVKPNVSASEKSTSKSEKITINNDKGRLSAEEIEQIIIDARERSIETCKAYALRDGIDASDVNFLQQRDYSPTVITGRNGVSSRLKVHPLDAKEAERIRKRKEQGRTRN